MLNSCFLTGNLGADPEIFYSSDGDPIATFNLAFRSSRKKTGWIKITTMTERRSSGCFWGVQLVTKHLYRYLTRCIII